MSEGKVLLLLSTRPSQSFPSTPCDTSACTLGGSDPASLFLLKGEKNVFLKQPNPHEMIQVSRLTIMESLKRQLSPSNTPMLLCRGNSALFLCDQNKLQWKKEAAFRNKVYCEAKKYINFTKLQIKAKKCDFSHFVQVVSLVSAALKHQQKAVLAEGSPTGL